MTSPADDHPGAEAKQETARRMRAIAAELLAAGLDAHLNETRGVLDITAALHRPGGKDIDLSVDEDGYVSLAYWNDPGATPAEVAAMITRVLTAITGQS